MVNSVGSTQPAIQCVPALFPGVKRPGCVIDHPPLSNAEVKEIVELLLACMVRPRAKFTFVYLIVASPTLCVQYIRQNCASS
jgi:hypothetical protein